MGNGANTKNETIEIRQRQLEGELICELATLVTVSLVLLDEEGKVKFEKKWSPKRSRPSTNGLVRRRFNLDFLSSAVADGALLCKWFRGDDSL